MYGYGGKILRVDLSEGKTWVEEPNEEFYRRYIGGRGFIAYYLLKETDSKTDPLGPDNLLIFALGAVTGNPIPGAGRHSVGAISPLTGTYGEAEAGGYWGAELKKAGFDAIVIKGASEKPVYLWIHDGKAEIRDATHLWGLKTRETQETIRKELEDNSIRVAQIGPAGEKLVRFACVMHDITRAAGRTGLGAVMGSKKLKAVAVKGSNPPDVVDPEKLKELSRWLAQNLNLVRNLHLYGTGAMMDVWLQTGNLPINNFRGDPFPNATDIDARTLKEKYRIRMDTCFQCPVACKKVVRIGEPWNVDPVYGGPEYETLASLGSDCGIDDLAAICRGNQLCNEYGMDTISAGATIAFAMECFENGILTKEDTGGLELAFGNAEAMVKALEMIGEREGLGNLLAEGVKRAAEMLGKGAEKFAIHVKGQEVPMHEPRLKRGLGLGYAVSPTGADHCHNMHDTALNSERIASELRSLGILEIPLVEDLGPKKVRTFYYYVNYRVLNNVLPICLFIPFNLQHKVEIVRAITGWNSTAWELLKAAERATTMTRVVNVMRGFKPDDDWLPERFFQPHRSGALSKTALDPEQLKRAIKLYYAMMGWDERGVPTEEKLHELDLDWTIEKLPRS
ncbi:MAG TPA: aldehyde ferredoxin oxidoreductase [Candidatus Korarchaeota archaeon]|nr:aldehyde ferredoxin oxidoreductase [Candidatus Korarchaeota archaeon]